tara:strand:+ start:197 stop:1285 length:1089 start_codon:yes stop_codon:yes gene_type:complete
MGDKFYRLINTLKNFVSKYKVKEKLQNALKFSLKQTEGLRTKGLTKKQTIVISSLLIVCLIIVLWPTTRVESPLSSFDRVEHAVVTGNTNEVIHLVEINNIAEDMSKTILSQINTKKLTNDLLSYMQKELENKITEDFFMIIDNKGDFHKNLENHNAVLSKTLNFLFNKTGKVIKRDIIEQTDEKAVIQIVVFRPDLEVEVPVNLELTYAEPEWIFSKIQNLPTLLKSLEEIEEKRVEKLNGQIKENFNNYIILKEFQKSTLNITDNSFLMRLSLENISDEDVSEVKAKLKLIHKGALLGTIDIEIPETIFANNFYEKAWSIKLNDYKSLSKLSKTSSANITPVLDIEKIVFSKGKVLELIK